jgi:hypothetical protein
MGDTIQFTRGLKQSIPQLSLGEPGLATDEERVYIGGNNGNIPLPNAADLSDLTNNKQDKIVDSGWLNVPLTIGSGTANYRKEGKKIKLKGAVTGLSSIGAFAVLPTGYRPLTAYVFMCATSENGSAYCKIAVYTNGEIALIGGSATIAVGTSYRLDGIEFYVE